MDTHPHAAERHNHGTRALVLGALGVVFGDIGTSPLYTFQECINHHHLAIEPGNILGVISLIFWSLTLVVTVKYVAVLMNCDNRGEGGILALLALVPAPLREVKGGVVGLVSLLVIAGAALLFGDGVITPAISVLSAMEGLVVASERLAPFVVPATCAILFALFWVQKRGTGSLGTFFGPIMLVWFLAIGGLGFANTLAYPAIWGALSPHHAVEFFVHHGAPGFAILGSVVLAVTGGEALYADMGHFGRGPIRIAWMLVAYPALVLCYFGQGALLLVKPAAISAPFFSMIPAGPWTLALVVLAAFATIIASQGLISAVFSLCHQAIRLGYMPRMRVLHTSSEVEGQIYLPVVNWGLAVACLALVLVFRESEKLAAAYGLAVSGTMALTSIVFYFVLHTAKGWSKLSAGLVLVAFLLLDIPFCLATCLKFFDGGYLPFALGLVLFIVMVTWCRGRSLLREYLGSSCGELTPFLEIVEGRLLHRLPGLGVVLSTSPTGTPPALAMMVRIFRAVHEYVFVVTISTEDVPYIRDGERTTVEPLGKNFYRVIMRHGFMEIPRVPDALTEAIQRAGLPEGLPQPTYVLTRESFLATNRGRMGELAENLFSLLSKNATNPSLAFNLPPEQVIELGFRVDL